MAGDWIKMRCNLSSHPKVVRIASRLTVTRVTVVGALHAVWTVADQHADADGVLDMDADSLDTFAETPGFCREMEAVGWLEILPDHVKFPEYHEHNGTTGKTRAGNQKRKSKSREAVTDVTKKCDNTVTREEKRREEDNSKELSSEKSPAKVPDPKDTALAEFIYAGVLAVAPKTKKPNLDNWANTIRLMRERDKHSRREIAEVFSWANNDPFWSVNILSPESLRSKFPRLSAKKDSQNENPTGSGNSSSGDGGDRSTVGKASSAAERRRQAILEQDGEDDSS